MKKKLFVLAVIGMIIGLPGSAHASSLSVTTLMTPGLDSTGSDSDFAMGNARMLSDDGRIAVFATASANYAPHDRNRASDVFAYDRVSKKTELISHSASGQPGNAKSFGPAVSANGRYVVYLSLATDIVQGVSFNCPNEGHCGVVLVYDRFTGQHVVANRASDNTIMPVYFFDRPSISADGRFVVFATRLPLPYPDAYESILMRDLKTGTTTLVGADNAGKTVRTFFGEPSVSQDGRYVTFTTSEPVVQQDTNGVYDVYVRDTKLGTTTLMSATADSRAAGNGESSGGIVSNDGRFVAFHSRASNFATGDTGGYQDIFLRDIATHEIRRISVAKTDIQGGYYSHDPDISADGRFVVYSSAADNLVPADTNHQTDIFLYDSFANITRRVNVRSHDGPQAERYSDLPAISGDGKTVLFRSWDNKLVPSATNLLPDKPNLYQVYNPVVAIPYYDPIDIADLWR